MRMTQFPKTDIVSGDSAQEKILIGVDKLYNPVASTLGASGRTVMIEKLNGRFAPTKDGVTVAKAIDLADPVEASGCETVKQASLNTAQEAGDGTTTSTIIARGIITRGIELLKDKSINYTDFNRGMSMAVEDINKQLTKDSTKVNLSNIINVATISANNDTELGAVIAKAFKRAGKHGVVIMDKSETSETYVSITEGFELENGYKESVFANNEQKSKCEFEQALVLISDLKIEKVAQIQDLLEFAIKNNRPIVVVADVEEEVMATLAFNKNSGALQSCLVSPSHFGIRRKEILKDLAILTGATLIDDMTGDNFENVFFEALGTTAKVTVTGTKSIFMTALNDEIKEHIALLKRTAKEADSKPAREWIEHRMAKISSAVAVVNVGASSESEQSEKADRVDDAINATQAALEEGIVAGGGVALLNIQRRSMPTIENPAIAAGYNCVMETITDPLKCIVENGDYDFEGVLKSTISKPNFGLNVKTGIIGDMFKMKIIDPVKVTKTALVNGVSAASTLLSTTSVITLRR